MGQNDYRFVPRHAEVGHGHAVLVFDGASRLHLPLTTFAREATRRLSASSVNVYLYALLPFLTFMDSRGRGEQELWSGEVHGVRHAVAGYLEEHLGCVIRRHRLGFELVSMTGRTRSNVAAFLAALKLFYVVMREVSCYTAENPLIDVTSRVLNHVDDDGLDCENNDPPRMPDISGVEPIRSHGRLTDSFFRLIGREWVPKIIDDPTFPVSVLSGGRQLPGWGLREECVTRLLFRDRWPHFRGDWAHVRGLGKSWVD
jgi:hypothetical protein